MPDLKLLTVTRPFTPALRRMLHDVFRPSATIGKRLRDSDINEEQGNIRPTESNSTGVNASYGQRNCVALQNEDAEEDAIVITALNLVPFCCHADLLLMNRQQLIEVADNLNEKLPAALQINTTKPDAFIRNSIEVIVGIRHVVPEAPKANRSLSLSLSTLDFKQESFLDSVLPLTPISTNLPRNRSTNSIRDFIAGPPLESLREENEESFDEADRPMKRRRMEDTTPDASPTPVRRKILMRSQSARAVPVQTQTPLSSRDHRILRSRSERLPLMKLGGIHRNITLARGRGRTKTQSAVMTSTPKPHKSPPMDYVAPADSRETISVNSLCTTSSSDASLSSTPCLDRVGIWLTRANAPESDAREVTSGMGGMSITTRMQASSSSSSAMNLSL